MPAAIAIARITAIKIALMNCTRAFISPPRSKKNDAATMNVSIVKPSNTRSTRIVTSVAVLLTCSCAPSMYARTISPMRSGSTLFAM